MNENLRKVLLEGKYNNYLQLFVDEFELNVDNNSLKYNDTINSLTDIKSKFIKNFSNKDIDNKIKEAKSLLNNLNINEINNLLNVDFNDYREKINEIIKNNLDDESYDNRLLDEFVNFTIKVLNNNQNEFKDFLDYLKELSLIDMTNFDTLHAEKYDIKFESLKGIEYYNHFLLTGATVGSRGRGPMYDLLSISPDLYDDKAEKLVKKYLYDLLIIESTIRDSYDLDYSQRALENNYKYFEKNYSLWEKNIDIYNSYISNNKLLQKLQVGDRKRMFPEAHTSLLYTTLTKEIVNIHVLKILNKRREYLKQINNDNYKDYIYSLLEEREEREHNNKHFR